MQNGYPMQHDLHRAADDLPDADPDAVTNCTGSFNEPECSARTRSGDRGAPAIDSGGGSDLAQRYKLCVSNESHHNEDSMHIISSLAKHYPRRVFHH